VKERHRWVKLRLHVYICRQCGCGKVNANTREDETGDWFTTYYTPDGRAVRAQHTPPCIIGPKTPQYLAKYADALAIPF
jgi:hypothetical protein